MKKVSFDLEVEIHDELKEEDVKKSLSDYLINEASFGAVVMKVIGEPDSPQHFDINFRKFDLKPKSKSKAKPKSKIKSKK
jgi:hypothetical protein